MWYSAYWACRSTTGHTHTHNSGLHAVRDVLQEDGVWGSCGVFRVSNWNRKPQLPSSLTLRGVLMSSFRSPVEIHAAMKAALFLFLFIRLSSFRPDIHYSFHLLRRSARPYNFNFSSSFKFQCSSSCSIQKRFQWISHIMLISSIYSTVNTGDELFSLLSYFSIIVSNKCAKLFTKVPDIVFVPANKWLHILIWNTA